MSNQKQYINIIRSNQNIKIDNQVLENNSIISSNQSVFLLQNNLFSSDTLFKLQALEQDIKETYISAICESKNQKIISKVDAKNKECTYIPFDSTHSLELDNTDIETITLFNNNGNIDYLVSPFTLLQNFLSNSLQSNTLNMLIHNDHIYTIILDENKRYIYGNIVALTSFNDIQNSQFYHDEVVEQKLYDEIYLLELTDLLSNTIKDYYAKFNNTNFIEKINLYYSIKQLNDEQITTLQDELMLDISYEQIHLDALMYDIATRNTATKYSYIEPRSKKTSFSLTTWIIIALSSLIIVFAIIFFMSENKEIEKEVVTDKVIEKILKKEDVQEKKKKKIIQEIKLPNHIYNNQSMLLLLQDIFNTIDDNTVLKEIQIQKDESTMICDFYTIEAKERFLNKTILSLYKKSEIILMNSNDNILTSIISNNKLLHKPKFEKKYYMNNIDNYMDHIASQKYLQDLLGNDLTIVFEDEIKTTYTKQIFSLTANIKEPSHFYKMIETINKQAYSINLDYPIEFVKTNNSLETTFTLIINQINHKNK